jgi:hypothetical protein
MRTKLLLDCRERRKLELPMTSGAPHVAFSYALPAPLNRRRYNHLVFYDKVKLFRLWLLGRT